MDRDRMRHTRCSFCGKSQDQVKKLIAGPGVYICDQCVELCNQVIAEEPPAPPQPSAQAPRGWIRRAVRRLPWRRGSKVRTATARATVRAT